MMRKVKRFLYTYVNSVIPEDSYYQKLAKVPFSFSVSYLFWVVYFTYVLLMVLGIVKTGFFMHKRELANNLIQKVKAYPDDLVISIKDGRLLSNYSKPYFMWVPEGDKQHLLAVVDETGTPDKIKMYGSLMLLTSNSFTFYNGSRYMSLPYGSREMMITKDAMIKVGKTLDSAYGIIKVILVMAGLFIIPFLLALFNAMYCIVVAMVSYLGWKTISQHSHKRVTYRRILQLSMHALTLPLLLISFMVLFDVPVLRLPFTFIVLLIIFTNTATYEFYMDHPSSS